MPSTQRRGFLQSAVAGGAAVAGMAASGCSSRRNIYTGDSTFTRRAYREFGSTGLMVTELGFGAALSSELDLYNAILDSGINFVDTAPPYMSGECQRTLAKAMKGRRDKVIVSSKFEFGQNLSHIETMLRELDTDYLDILILHAVDGRDRIMNEDNMKVADEARRKGMARFVGVSTHKQVEGLQAVLDSGFWEVALVPYSYFTPPDAFDAIRKAREAGIAMMAMKPLLNIETMPSTIYKKDPRKHKTPDTTKEMALIKGALENPFIDVVLAGMTEMDHLHTDIRAMGKPMTLAERSVLRRHAGDIRGRICFGLAGCTGCEGQCPNGVDICSVNRCLGYRYGYGDPALAATKARELRLSESLARCGDCDECTVGCVNGLDLAANIREARSLFA